ncbi:site-specific integrase [Alphaproteobacteria bacterium]|nr:site-specific integrase [Alphaproteobacteria bacterium]
MAKITKRTVDTLTVGETVWDAEIKGFGVRCQRQAKNFILKYRFDGRQRWFTIGRYGSPWTVGGARDRAKALLGMVAEGDDPSLTRDSNKARPTVSDLCDRYLDEYAAHHKKASSAKTDRSNIDNHVRPLLGKLFVAEVTVADIEAFKLAVRTGKTARGSKKDQRGGSTVTGGTGVANRCLALVSKMFNLAERWSLRPSNANPVKYVERYPENAFERFLSNDELVRLAETLEAAKRDGTEGPFVIAAIRLLTFTGCRVSEILSLQWAQVDFDRAMLHLADSKTGQKPVFLSPPALEVLAGLPRVEGNPHVIVGARKGSSLVNIRKPWGRIRERAGLNDVRLHDLRHTYASAAAAGGLSLPMIGRLLGHTQAVTTQRYAHLAADPVRAAADAIGNRLAAAMNRNDAAQVVDIKEHKNAG